MALATLSGIYAEKDIEETLCKRLGQFRLSLESQADKPVAAMEVPVAVLLSDLGVFLCLSEEQHDRVLGEQGVSYVNEVLATRWKLKTSGH